jgi:transcriptional regulator with XRE-family HTH domain
VQAVPIGEDLVERVALRIGELRRARGITQEQMAERLGTAVQNYQRIEGGKQNLTLVLVARIADVLAVDPMALLERPAEPRPRRGRSKLAR